MRSGILFLALAAAPMLAGPALAGPRDDVRAASQRCDSIVEERTWLDCYYGAAQPVRAELGLPPAPNSQLALVPPAQPGAPARQNSGGVGNFFQRLMTQKDVKAEPPTRMASYDFNKAGLFTVTLANGEVWRQSAMDSNQPKWRGPAANYVVTILPGSKMQVGEHETYIVERVR